MTWFEGLQFCSDLEPGASLAIIPDPRTQAFLEILADEHSDQSWLIGGFENPSNITGVSNFLYITIRIPFSFMYIGRRMDVGGPK